MLMRQNRVAPVKQVLVVWKGRTTVPVPAFRQVRGLEGYVERRRRAVWLGPRAPRVALLLSGGRATETVLSPLCDAKVGQMVAVPPRLPEGEMEVGGRHEEVEEEEGPGSPT